MTTDAVGICLDQCDGQRVCFPNKIEAMSSKEENAGVSTSGSGHKRLKPTEDSSSTTDHKSVLTLDISLSSLDSVKKEYVQSRPFPYGHIPNVFKTSYLEQVIAEIKDNSVVNFKESDLFKVYQSIDLANLDSKEAKMPAVMQLRSILYSAEWRSWMEAMNNLEAGTLSDQVDCACNCHLAGCHLLCHDDVIGTRKISYIIYLTETEPAWNASEGGALELYDSIAVSRTVGHDADELTSDTKNTNDNDGKSTDTRLLRIPKTTPCKTILPIFNHMAFFVVEPGRSFHAVQEVLGSRPRLSLQGWYHAATAPANIQDATLQRLKSYQGERAVKEEDTEGEYTPFLYDMEASASESVHTLSANDRAYLNTFLQLTYLTDESIAEIRLRFEQDSSVQLRNFLSEEWVKKIHAAATAADANIGNNKTIDPTSPDYYTVGVTPSWRPVGPPHKQRFLEFALPENADVAAGTPPTSVTSDDASDSTGAILHEIKTKLLQSQAFGRFLAILTSLGPPMSQRGRVRRFRPGRDYTVAHYGLLTETSVLDATICFAAGNGSDPSSIYMDDEEGDHAAPNGDDINYTEADETWQSGDSGGFECYIAADDDGDEEAADEYNQDVDTELLSVSASNNTLSLVYRDPGTIRFVKYVGFEAPSSRWDVAMEYEVPAAEVVDDYDEDGEEEDE